MQVSEGVVVVTENKSATGIQDSPKRLGVVIHHPGNVVCIGIDLDTHRTRTRCSG